MGLLLLALLTQAGCSALAEERGDDPAAGLVPPPLDLELLEQAIHQEVLNTRRLHGRSALGWDKKLVAVARGHARDMARRGYFSHQSPEGRGLAERLGRRPTCTWAGENLFSTTRYSSIQVVTQLAGAEPAQVERTPDWFTGQELAARTVRGWLDSPGHRRNLLGPEPTREGIGVALQDSPPKVLVVQVLCK